MASGVRALVLLGSCVLGCAGEPRGATTPAPVPQAPSSPEAEAGALGPCLAVHAEPTGQSVEVEGRLVAGSAAQPFVLRLIAPRCVVGLERSAFVNEVYLASTSFDLRPLLGAHLRVSGEAIGATSNLEGSAIVVLAASVERIPTPTHEP